VPRILNNSQDPAQHGGVRTFHQKSTFLAQFASGPQVVQIWSRSTLKLKVSETLEIHRAGYEDRMEGNTVETLAGHMDILKGEKIKTRQEIAS
jgi:hypothetical protein